MSKKINMKRQISREQWQELDIRIQILWVKYFQIKNIWKSLPDIGQIMEYLAGEWIIHRDEIFNGKGEPIDKLWALLILKCNKHGQRDQKGIS